MHKNIESDLLLLLQSRNTLSRFLPYLLTNDLSQNLVDRPTEISGLRTIVKGPSFGMRLGEIDLGQL